MNKPPTFFDQLESVRRALEAAATLLSEAISQAITMWDSKGSLVTR